MLRHPVPLGAVYALALWAWHLPLLYESALRHAAVHDVQHLMFFGAACLFWRGLLDPLSRFRLDGGTAVLLLFATTLHSTVLGVLMTLAPAPWYAEYVGRTQWWGLSPLEDQQLAGLIMWMPACVPYVVAAAALLGIEIHGRTERVPPVRLQSDESPVLR